jgi:hypothetical protein
MAIQPLHIANITLCGVVQLIQLIFLVVSLIKFEFINHHTPIAYVSEKISIKMSLLLAIVCLASFILGCVSSLTSYLHNHSVLM